MAARLCDLQERRRLELQRIGADEESVRASLRRLSDMKGFTQDAQQIVQQVQDASDALCITLDLELGAAASRSLSLFRSGRCERVLNARAPRTCLFPCVIGVQYAHSMSLQGGSIHVSMQRVCMPQRSCSVNIGLQAKWRTCWSGCGAQPLAARLTMTAALRAPAAARICALRTHLRTFSNLTRRPNACEPWSTGSSNMRHR